MDKETAVELEKLKGEVKSLNTEVNSLKEFYKVCRNVIIKTVLWLLGVGAAGVISGWQMSENTRKMILEWISK